MPKITRKQKQILQKYNLDKEYSLLEAASLVKETNYTKFDASVDIAVRLSANPQKADQMIRGVVSLPHGTGKTPKILVLCTPDKEKEVKEAGADYIGCDEYIKKIKEGWTDIDTIIATPSLMSKIGKLGKVLGPRGLMPNPKEGTVTLNPGQAVQEIKAGKVSFKVDKNGIVHARIAQVSFPVEKIVENVKELIDMLIRLKPNTTKGSYIKSITLSSTMGKGVRINNLL